MLSLLHAACLKLLFFGGGSRRYPPNWLPSKGQNYQRGVLIISVGAIEGHFEWKTQREVHQGGLVLARKCPASTGTCNPQETGLPGLPASWSPTLFPWSGLVGLPPVSWTERTIKSSPFCFRHGGHCCSGDLVGRINFWFFFWVACKSYSNGLRSVLSFLGSMLNKSWVWSL